MTICSTLIDSTPGVIYTWDEFRKQYTHLPSNIAHLTHGRRLVDTLREYCRITDETELEVSRPVDRCTRAMGQIRIIVERDHAFRTVGSQSKRWSRSSNPQRGTETAEQGNHELTGNTRPPAHHLNPAQ